MLYFSPLYPMPRLVARAVATLAIAGILIFTARLFLRRRLMRKLLDQGLPMPPHDFLFGHLLVVTRLLSQLPSDAHPFYIPDQVRRNYPDVGPNYYLDLWPFAPSMLVLGSPDTINQVNQEHILHKYPQLRAFIRPLTDNLDILSMEGQMWKKWRAVFNPGFSAAHLMTLVPAMVTEVETFCQILREHAEKEDMFQMKALTDNLTMNVIGRVALDTHLDSQRQYNPMVHSIRQIIRWLSFGSEPNLFERYHPLRPFVHWYHSRIVNAHLSKDLDRRYDLHRTRETGDVTDLMHTKTIIDLALSTYTSQSDSKSDSTTASIDPFFKRICMSQIKLFLFSGHDTTSSAICFHLYLISKHASALARLRAEHDSVFTRDTNRTASLISSNPHLLHQLPFTTAVIKESLRLFPTVTISRQGERGFHVTDRAGHRFPTDGFLVFPNIHTPQHDPAFWPHADSFLPERWLVGTEHPLYPVKGAWRAFEHGPRACIGQELAMLEMKTVLVMVVRTFDFKPAYEELDRERGGVVKMVHGERAYQVGMMQPQGDLPCRVEMVRVQGQD